MITLLRVLYRWCWGIAIALLVLLALYASLGRYYIQYLPDYSHHLGDYLQEEAGIDLALSGLTTDWTGLSPVLAAEQVMLRRQDQLAARLVGARGKLGVVSGLLSRRSIDLLELQADRLELHLYEAAEGYWQFAGYPLVSRESTGFDLVSLLLSVRTAEVRELAMILHYADGEKADIWGQRLRLAGDAGFRRLRGNLGIGESQPTRLIAELSGDPRSRDFRLNVHVRMEGSSFKTVAPLLGPYQALGDMRGSGEFWLQLSGRQQARWQGRLAIPELALGSLWQSPQRLTDATFEFAGILDDDRARTWFSELGFYWQGQYIDWGGAQLTLALDGGDSLRLALPSLDLANTQARLLNADVLSPTLTDALAEMAPQGRLRNLVVELPLTEQARFAVSAELSSVVLQSWRKAPSIRGLNGYLEASAAGGELSILTDAIQLGLPGVYAEPLQFQELATRLAWSIEDDMLRLRSGRIRAHDRDSVLTGRLALSLPLTPSEREPTMDLLVGASDIDADQREQYLPKLVGDGLRDWLAASIRGGHVSQAAFLYRGSLRAGGKPAVQLALDAENVKLDYHPDWPAIQRASARLLLDGGRVSVHSDEALIFDDVELRDIDVGIDRPGEVTWLSIQARADSSVNSALRVVRESALREQVGASFDDWSGSGRVAAAIDLRIPLESGAEPEARVDTRIEAEQLTLENLGLQFRDIRGPLVFDSARGLNGPDIQASLFGRPLAINITQTKGRPVRVNARGRLAAEDVRTWLEQPLIGFASGEADVNVDISAGAERVHLNASSDLFDVVIDLPEPLGKPAGTSRLLELQIPLSEQSPRIDLAIEQLGRLRIELDDQRQFAGGSFALGAAPVPAPASGRFSITGALGEARLSDWQAVWQRYRTLTGNAPASKPLRMVVEDFSVQRLDAFGRIWREVELDADNREGGWQLELKSRRLQGQVSLPANADTPITVALQRFNLPELPPIDIAATTSTVRGEELASESVVSRLATLNPAQFPRVDFSVAELAIADAPLGNLAFSLRPLDNGAELRGLRGNLRGLRLGVDNAPLHLRWTRGEAGDLSELRGPVAVADIGKVLENWQFDRVMESRSGRADLDLRWAAPPDLLSPRSLSGNLSMRFDNGRFLRGPETASGTLRMVGLLNFANIIRRLQFNFRDVFEKGIHYDRIRGAMQFDQGVMQIPEAIEIQGPSSSFKIRGSLDFHTDLTRMELLATLPVGSNLPWAAAFIGGLPAAVGVYIASKVFEEQVDMVSTLVYDVRGPWQQPELEFKRLFGDDSAPMGDGGESPAKSMRGKPGK